MNLALVPCRSQKQSYMTISADVQQQVHGSRYESVIIGLGGKAFYPSINRVSVYRKKKKIAKYKKRKRKE